MNTAELLGIGEKYFRGPKGIKEQGIEGFTFEKQGIKQRSITRYYFLPEKY